MANLRIFVSSTCYDLRLLRSQLRAFISRLGHEPLLSDYADVLYDPRFHTHSSCIQEINNCDMVLLIIGSRFGGAAIPDAINLVDFDSLRQGSKSNQIFDGKLKLSVTQLEVLKAIELGVPIYTLIEDGVYSDHLTYEKNKDRTIKGVSGNIASLVEYPHIEKQDTAMYIFEFINYLRHRVHNNNIQTFSKLDEIEEYLQKQWSALFQRLLQEQRFRAIESQKIDVVASQIADLKTAILTSLSPGDLKDTAKATIKFRTLVQLVHALIVGAKKIEAPREIKKLLASDLTWKELLDKFSIVEFRPMPSSLSEPKIALIRKDETYFIARFSVNAFEKCESQWDEFKKLSKKSKEAVVEAILEATDSRPMYNIRYVDKPFSELEADKSSIADLAKINNIFRYYTVNLGNVDVSQSNLYSEDDSDN